MQQRLNKTWPLRTATILANKQSQQSIFLLLFIETTFSPNCIKNKPYQGIVTKISRIIGLAY